MWESESEMVEMENPESETFKVEISNGLKRSLERYSLLHVTQLDELRTERNAVNKTFLRDVETSQGWDGRRKQRSLGHLQGQPHGVAVLLQRVQLQRLSEVAAARRLMLHLTADTHLDAVELNLDRGTQSSRLKPGTCLSYTHA